MWVTPAMYSHIMSGDMPENMDQRLTGENHALQKSFITVQISDHIFSKIMS
jgi:hypothetical protein